MPDSETLRYEKLALAASPDAVIVADNAGLVLYWNRGAETVFGYAAADAQGRTLDDLIGPQAAFAGEGEADMSDGVVTREMVCRRRDGALLYVDMTMRPVDDSGGLADQRVISAKDITRRKVLRDARAIEARFGAVLDSTPDGIVMLDRTGSILFANRQAESLFGYDRGQLRGQAVEVLMPARFRHLHVGHRARFMEQPRVRAMGAGLDLFGLRRDGAEFPIEISLSPLHADEGPLVISAIRDTTERRRFEVALQEKNEELARASQAKDNFLAGMSHELRTPLNAVIVFTGMLLMRLPGPLTTDQERQLRTIETSARHLLGLINGILDLAKIEAGKIDLHLEATDCRALVGDLVESLRPQAQARGLYLETDLPADAVGLRTDVRAFSQIVLNLLGNAIKFTEQGGVRVLLRRDTPPPLVTLSIADTGVGISPEDHGTLFGMFERGAAMQRRRTEGSGLGLHLSGKLAALLGGEIILESELGRGSTFSLILPDGGS
jgi:PAS domain S-box-containing protein